MVLKKPLNGNSLPRANRQPPLAKAILPTANYRCKPGFYYCSFIAALGILH
jgi:hypothetical protein